MALHKVSTRKYFGSLFGLAVGGGTYPEERRKYLADNMCMFLKVIPTTTFAHKRTHTSICSHAKRVCVVVLYTTTMRDNPNAIFKAMLKIVLFKLMTHDSRDT